MERGGSDNEAKIPAPVYNASEAKPPNIASGLSPKEISHQRQEFSPLPWSQYFDSTQDIEITSRGIFRVYTAGSSGPYVVLLHGGGHTALTWCLTASKLKKHCRVVAIDFRGHGSSATVADTDLSADTLVTDTICVLSELLPPKKDKNLDEPTIVVGHSMGGAIAVRVAAREEISSLIGLIVIDVVEGTAISSLDHMHSILNQRPKSFNSEAEAIEWSVRTGVIKNAESARASIPSQLKKATTGSTLKWRTDLHASGEYWRGWFNGLSEMFLATKVHKVLLLAGTDRLDTALTRGQMQGKFQLLLMYGCGHVIQEDNPEQTAEAILNFCSRISILPAVTDQGSLLAQKLERARSMIPKNQR